MSQLDRRQFLKLSGAGLIGVTMGSVSLKAFAADPVSLTDPVAVAMKYVEKSAVADKCDTCMHMGAGTEQHRSCAIFGGKLVNKDGWCSGYYMKKP